MKTKPIPNPGSKEAIALGCTCLAVDNFYGRGWMGNPGYFAYNIDCPVHAEEIKEALKYKEHDRHTTA